MRLSRPIDQICHHYTVVVVGSGYGGAIAACRLSRANQDVCVLERGREIHPGQYPNTVRKAFRSVQARTPLGRLGSRTAMFEFHLDRDISVVVGCGLGGTSLINANVALRPKPWIFDHSWPSQLQAVGDRELKPYYELAEEMLGSTPYPDRWPLLPKVAALQRAAEAVGGIVELPELNVTFVDGRNRAGVEQHRCVLCGDCIAGCNYAAKNTVLMNYLPDAHRHGAHIFTEVDVRTVRRLEDGRWIVTFNVLGRGRERFDGPTQFVTADLVVLAAGTLGTTEILLRSERAGLALSGTLGQRFSGNGDVLAFAYDIDAPVRGVGRGYRPVLHDGKVGPTITGKLDLTETLTPGLMVQEGALPGALARLLPSAFWAAATIGGVDDRKGLRLLIRRLREAASIPLGPYRGALNRTLTYLVMCTEDTFGRLALNGDRLEIDWKGVADRPVFRHVNDVIGRATRRLAGTFIRNPMQTSPFGHTLLTVHPLGGCAMGDDARTGVVNHKGQVFAGKDGQSVHKGLYVADGSIIPRPLDANPLLTISALAERTCDLIAEDKEWTIDHKPSGDPWPDPPSPRPGLSFSERLSGFFSTRVSSGYRGGWAQGQSDGTSIEFVVTIDYDDLVTVLADPSHPGRISGTVVAPALSPHRMTVEDGRFVMFDRDEELVETWHMFYQMKLVAEDGRRFGFFGFKVLHDRPGLDAWPDTTTLYVQITDDSGNRIGVGIMRNSVPDFLRELLTFKVHGVEDPVRRRAYLWAFFRLFIRFLLRVYGGPLDQAGAFPTVPRGPACDKPPPPPVKLKRELLLPKPDVWWCDQQGRWQEDDDLGEGAWLRLTRYNKGGDKGPVLLAGGFGMSSRALICDTIPPPNLGEFLHQNGYDVWLLDYRASTDLPSACEQFTLDDIATRDWPTAVAKVRLEAGVPSVQAFGHCVGSVSLLMAILAGHPEMQHVRSAVCAQFATDPVTSTLNRIKAWLHISEALHRLGVYKVTPDTRFDVPNVLLDLILRLLPIASEERCGQAVCRWINAIYGCTHRHARLNDATHQALNDLFGVGNIKSLEHLATMMRRERAVDFSGRDVYNDRARLRIPILFLQGPHNYIFYSEGMDRTIRWLRDANDPSLYTRALLPGYAHLDAIVGRKAAQDVYPKILEHLDRFAAPR